MENLRRILVIEDNDNHRRDVEALLEELIAQGAPLAVDYATTLDEAMDRLGSTKYDGILSDVFFPKKAGDKEGQHGTTIATYAMEQKIPVTLVTSMYHHGDKAEPVNIFMNSSGLGWIDSTPSGEDDFEDDLYEAPSKNWKGGYANLMHFIELNREGKITIQPQEQYEFVTSPYNVEVADSEVPWGIDRWFSMSDVTDLFNKLGREEARNGVITAQDISYQVNYRTSGKQNRLNPSSTLSKVLQGEYCRGLYPV